jgi:C-methyltransferase C-terminal domain
MDDDTLLFIQTSQADMILNGEFDTIYHEHISFYNINSMNELCKRMSLNLIDVVKCPLHGNSYIFVISKYLGRPAHIQNLIDMERKAGLYTDQTYIDYAAKCDKITKELKEIVERYQSLEVGFNVVGYGAAAKGMTLLNYSGIKPDFIVDDNPLKQGKFTPGSNVPIVGSEKLDELNGATAFVPLAWNFFDEIKSRIKLRHDNPYDVFITYFPKVEIRK